MTFEKPEHPKAFIPTVGWVTNLAKDVLSEFRNWSESDSSDLQRNKIRRQMQKVARFQQTRCIGEAERVLSTSHRLGKWSAQLFLSFRDKRAMVDYLRFQEWVFESDEKDPLQEIVDGLTEAFSDLGKKSSVNVRLGVGLSARKRISCRINLDPFKNFRAIYLRILRASRQRRNLTVLEKAANMMGRVAIRVKFLLVETGTEYYIRWIEWKLRRHPEFVPKNVLRHINLVVEDIFAEEIQSGTLDLNVLYAELSDFMEERVASLWSAIPDQLSEPRAVAKFFKVWLGVIIGRMSEIPDPPAATTHYVINSFKIAFCWASTYPLVDDVLDSSKTSSCVRKEMADVMRAVFRSDPLRHPLSFRSCIELRSRMLELLELLDLAHRDAAKNAIMNVFEAHQVDSGLRSTDPAIDVEERFNNALLKSMLVRIATMHVCGIFPTAQDYLEMARVAIFNQLGDDIWDATEDLAENRVTPVTLGLLDKGPDAYDYYLDYAAYLCQFASVERPAVLAISHTYRLAWDCGDATTRNRLKASIEKFSPKLDMWSFFGSTQHIDPDSLIFDLEDGLRSMMPKDTPHFLHLPSHC